MNGNDCLARNTRVSMADGSTCPIDQLRLGDMVATDAGAAPIRDIISGVEDELLHIETEGGAHLFATSMHPVFTADGAKRSYDLRLGDRIRMKEGFDVVRYANYEPYHDTVRNLVFDEERSFYADGFLVGDYYTQGRMRG